MATRLQDFREQYPQYGDLSDEQLGEALRQKHYPDVDPARFRSSVGLPEPEWATYPKDPDGFPIDPKRPELAVEDDVETERSIGVFRKGRHYNVPSIVNGERVSAEEAVKAAGELEARGWEFPNYATAEEANAAAERRSRSILGAREKWQEETAPTVWQRVKRAFRGSEQDPGTVLKDELPLVDEFEAPARDPEDYRYEDSSLAMQVIAGTDEYLAGRNWSDASEALGDYLSAKETSTAPLVVGRGGGYAAVLGGLRRATDRGRDPAVLRQEARDRLQESLDARQRRLARAQNVSYSKDTQEALEAKGFLESGREVLDDPVMFIAETGLRSLPNMAEAIPLSMAFGMATGPLGFAVGAGIGEGLVEYRSAYAEYLQKHKVDTNNADSLIAAAENTDLLRKAHEYALTRSTIIGTVGTLTGHTATLPLGGWAKSLVGKELANVAAQIPVQAIGEGVGELGAQAATLEGDETLRWGEIYGETAGGAIGAPLEVGAATITGVRGYRAHRRAARVQAEAEAMLNPDNAVPRETSEPPKPSEPDTSDTGPAPPDDGGGPGTYPDTDEQGRPFRRVADGGLWGDDEVNNPFKPDRAYPPGTELDAEPPPGPAPETPEPSTPDAEPESVPEPAPGTPRDFTDVYVDDPSGRGPVMQPYDTLEGLTVGEVNADDMEVAEMELEGQGGDFLGVQALAVADIDSPHEDFLPDVDTEFAEDVDRLTAEITASGRIDPIVVWDMDGHFQLIEGAHRFEALRAMGKVRIPAMVVRRADPNELEQDDTTEGADPGDSMGRTYDPEVGGFQAPEAAPEPAPAPTATEPAPEAPETPATPPRPPEWPDVRIKRRFFRDQLYRMASDLTPGGGVTYMREGNDPTGAIIGRTPSQNPQWFQDLNGVPELRMTVRQVWAAIDKAIKGKKLGVREIRVIQSLLNQISDQRTAPEEMDAARQQLETARDARAAARRLAGLPEPTGSTTEGETFEDGEYDAEMTAESRMMFELMTRAEAAGISEDELEALTTAYDDDQELMTELERRINENDRERPPGPETTEAEPGPAAPATEAPADTTGDGAPPAELREGGPHYAARPWRVTTKGEGDLYVGTGGRRLGTVTTTRTAKADLAVSVNQAELGPDYLAFLLGELRPVLATRARGNRQGRLTPADVTAVLADFFAEQTVEKQQLDLFLAAAPVPNQAVAPRLDAAKQDAVDAIAALRSVPSVAAQELASRLAGQQVASLVGRTIRSPLDLATLAQAYRDPRFETLRLIFLDENDQVVAQLGQTMRLPATAPWGVAGRNAENYAEYWAGVMQAAAQAGAKSMYLLHNHPSGNPTPSDADVTITREAWQLFENGINSNTFEKLPGHTPITVRGHVVINHNRYGFIDTIKSLHGTASSITIHDAPEFDQPSFQRQGGIAGQKIAGPPDVYDLAAKMQLNPDSDDVVIIHANNRHIVQSVSLLPATEIGADVKRNRRTLYRHAMANAGVRLFIVGRNKRTLQALGNFVVDAVWIKPDGSTQSLAGLGEISANQDLYPTWRAARVTSDTSPAFDYLRPIAKRARETFQKYGDVLLGVSEEGPKKPGGDLFGEDVSRRQAIADEIRRRDAQRNQGQESVETGRPGDLFSQARQQMDITDQQPRAGIDRRRRQEPLSEPDRRRQDRRIAIEQERRNRPIAESADEAFRDELTGAYTLEAYNLEKDTFEWFAAVDMDSLGWVNDNMGHNAGDAMLIAIVEALEQEGVSVYRKGGDEFIVATNEGREHLEAALKLADAILGQQKTRAPGWTTDQIAITWAVDRSYDAADVITNRRKREKEAAGKRSPSKTIKPHFAHASVEAMAKPINMEAGTNYVGMIGRHGALPIDPNNNLHLGNGRVVRIPKEPVRREHILAIMQKHFGKRIYEGRVKGKLRLGFYRPGHGEIRLKHANDIEVAAHEVAHFLDDRNPWIAELYKQFRDELKEVSYDVEKLHEGYAEFMRLYLTQESMAMERAPAFYDAFTKALRKDHKQLNAMLDDVQELMHAWTQQGARARGASKMGTAPANFIERIRRAFPVSFFQSALDGLRAIKEIELTLGGQTRGLTTAYEKLRLAMGGANSTLEAAMFYGTPAWREDGQGLEFSGEGLLQVFGNWWGDHDFGMYLLARRAAELSTQGRENLMRPDEILAWLKYAQENPEAEAIAARYQEYNDRMLDFAEGAGVVDASGRQKMQEMNKNYVPFYRVIESLVSGKPVQAGGSPFMRLKGGTQNVAVIWDNIVQQNGMLIHAAMINDGKRSILSKLGVTERLGKATGNQTAGLFASPISTDSRRVLITGDQVTKAAVEAMGWSMAAYKMAKAGMVGSEEEIVLLQAVEAMEQGLGAFVPFFEINRDPQGNVDFYTNNGKKHFFEIHDPALWDALRFIGPKGTNLVLQIMGAFSATLRRGVVAVPVFQVKNIMRDTVQSWMLSSHIKIPAARALRQAMTRYSKDTGYQEMLLNGGGFANRAQGLEVQRRLIINPLKLTAMYDRFMSRFENANRLAEYKAARAAGQSPRRAALLSRDISTDFAMRGSSEVARFLAISVPFLNARMQGMYRLGRIATDYRSTAVSFAMRGVALAAATAALYSLNKDDDRYKELPEDVKDLYWVFFYGAGEDDYFLIPKPFEPGMLFGTVVERSLEYTETENGKEFADALGWIFLQSFHMDMTPQPFQPWLDVSRNKDFTGTPIIPYGLENVAPSEQFMYYTSETVKEAGRIFGVSPIKMEYMLRGYTGTLGTYALAASDALIRASTDPLLSETGEYPSRGETWKENLVVKGLIDPLVTEGPPRRTKYVNDLYDMVREAEIAANTMARKMDRQAEDAIEYVSDPNNQFMRALVARAGPDDIGAPPLADVRNKLNEIRKTMDLVRADKVLSADEKRVQLWELLRARNELARVVMQEVEKLKKEIEQQQTDPQAAAGRVSDVVASAQRQPPPPRVAQLAP